MPVRTLEDRVAIVTGAARGIGLATAATLLERGACVVIGWARVDVADQPSVAALVDGAVERFGRLDIRRRSSTRLRRLQR